MVFEVARLKQFSVASRGDTTCRSPSSANGHFWARVFRRASTAKQHPLHAVGLDAAVFTITRNGYDLLRIDSGFITSTSTTTHETLQQTQSSADCGRGIRNYVLDESKLKVERGRIRTRKSMQRAGYAPESLGRVEAWSSRVMCRQEERSRQVVGKSRRQGRPVGGRKRHGEETNKSAVRHCPSYPGCLRPHC